MFHEMDKTNTKDIQMNWTPDENEVYVTRKGERLDGIAVRWRRFPDHETRPYHVYIYVDGKKEPVYLGYTYDYWTKGGAVRIDEESKNISIMIWDEAALKAREMIRADPHTRHLLIYPSYYCFYSGTKN